MSVAIHASARYANARRSLMVYLATVGVSAPIVDAEDARFSSDSVPSFVRVQIATLPEILRGGHPDGGRAYEGTLQVDCECYARATDGKGVATVDLAEQLADEVSAALRIVTVPILDYLADPANPAATLAALQFIAPPQRVAPRDADGWQRRIVSAEALWFLRKE